MHPELSVVIISAGTSPWIKDIVKRCELFSKDIIIVSNNQAFITERANDSSSTRRWVFRDFKGYGNQKNFGTSLAKFDWIVNLDDDEIPSTDLVEHLLLWKEPNSNTKALRIKRINFCNESAISWGKWGDDYSVRIYHTSCRWDDKMVHETLVTDGKIYRNAKVRIVREGIVVYTGELESLKRFKDDVKEVVNGQDCGLNIKDFNDIKVGDVIEAYEEVSIQRTL